MVSNIENIKSERSEMRNRIRFIIYCLKLVVVEVCFCLFLWSCFRLYFR